MEGEFDRVGAGPEGLRCGMAEWLFAVSEMALACRFASASLCRAPEIETGDLGTEGVSPVFLLTVGDSGG